MKQHIKINRHNGEQFTGNCFFICLLRESETQEGRKISFHFVLSICTVHSIFNKLILLAFYVWIYGRLLHCDNTNTAYRAYITIRNRRAITIYDDVIRWSPISSFLRQNNYVMSFFFLFFPIHTVCDGNFLLVRFSTSTWNKQLLLAPILLSLCSLVNYSEHNACMSTPQLY